MVKAEVEFLTREAVVVLFDVGPCNDWHLFSRDGPSCEKEGKQPSVNKEYNMGHLAGHSKIVFRGCSFHGCLSKDARR